MTPVQWVKRYSATRLLTPCTRFAFLCWSENIVHKLSFFHSPPSYAYTQIMATNKNRFTCWKIVSALSSENLKNFTTYPGAKSVSPKVF